ncbi:phosphoribosylaminoimidazolesuccinocarboxamide synthase [Verruconis gallopava]|uniref:Phosphoribosylaminoimidazole-succinocarboxamide synthase n=1 Tax=Verruconis gallopava TaxID=253628 RepID=A0A0D2A9L8_9PEZI|nr:phosphoribosylaminoimidazolesuccinocarboxamide synthase [Verruconis gallopava]KIW03305.1 phosphoribosylaminoimidazolesuccinocarboxamide synthase [Verruconis gallopava]
MSASITTTDLSSLYKPIAKGKVRDLYEVDEATLLFIATDRISAYDVILKNGIPDKGALLTKLSAHWFDVLTKAIPSLKTHFLTLELPPKLAGSEFAKQYLGRSMQVRKLKVIPLESIVRGYITGSAWTEYKKHGTVHGIAMPAGLVESQKLMTPIWTPSTKAEQGEHDENISPEKAATIVGKDIADRVERLSLDLYTAARDYAADRGIIIADTKFEFGLDESTLPPTIVLVDEVLTPDSSRFWSAAKYQAGRSQESLDKQYLRDWLTSNGLKGKNDISMPEEVVARTRAGYVEAYERLTGEKWLSG